MIEDFVNEVTGNAMQAVATVTVSAGLGDAVQRLGEPMRWLVIERLAAQIAAGAEAEIFDREWAAFLGAAKLGAPDRRAQVLQLLKEMGQQAKADLPARPDTMTTLRESITTARAYGPAVDAITETTMQAILRALNRGGRSGGLHRCRGLRLAVKDAAIDLLLEMEKPDTDKLALYMKVSVFKWVERAILGDIP